MPAPTPWLRFIPSVLWPSPPPPVSTPQGNDPRIGSLEQTFSKIPDWALPPELGSRQIEPPPAVLGKPEPVVAVPPFDYDQNVLGTRIITPPAAVVVVTPTIPPQAIQAKQPQDFPDNLLQSRDVVPPPAVLGQAKTIEANQPQDYPQNELLSRDVTPPPAVLGQAVTRQAKQPQDFPEQLLGTRDVVPPPAVLGQAKTVQAETPQDYDQNLLGSRDITPPPAPVTTPFPPPVVYQGEFQAPEGERKQVSQTLQPNPGGGSYATTPVTPPYTVAGQNQEIISGVPQPDPFEPKDPYPQVFVYYNAAPPIYRVISAGQTNQGFQFFPVTQPEVPEQPKPQVLFEPPPFVAPVRAPIYNVIVPGGTNQNFDVAPAQQDVPVFDKSRALTPPPAALARIFTAVHAGASNQMALGAVVQPDAPFVDSPRRISVPPAASGANPTGGTFDPNYFLIIHS